MWLLFLISTMLMGYYIILLIKTKFNFNIKLIIHLGLSWITGSTISYHILWTITALCTINKFVIFVVSALQGLISYFCYCLSKKPKFGETKLPFKSDIEKFPDLFLLLFIVTTIIISKMKNHSSYCAHQIEYETAFVSSILHGCNARRNNYFRFIDPSFAESSYKMSALPLLYKAAICGGGLSIFSTNFILATLNFISLSISAYSYFMISPSRAMALFSFYFLIIKSKLNVLPIFFSYTELQFSMGPIIMVMSLLSVNNLFSQKGIFVIAGILIISIPNTFAAISLLFIVTCNARIFWKIFPVFIYHAPKILTTKFHLYPMWREEQMNGMFFGPVVHLWNSTAWVLLACVFYNAFYKNIRLIHYYLTCLSVYFAMVLLRQNFDKEISNAIIAILVFPHTSCAVSTFVSSYFQNFSKTKSFITFFGLTLALVFFIPSLKIFSNFDVSIEFNEDDYSLAQWIDKNTPRDSIILYGNYRPNPVLILSGRQVLSDNFKLGKIKGHYIESNLKYYRGLQVNFYPLKDNQFLVERNTKPFFPKIRKTKLFENSNWTVFHLAQ